MTTLARRLTSQLQLHSKRALVIGGTQGIGAGVAKRFAELGANVHIVGRDQNLASSVLDSCKALASGSEQEFGFTKADLSTTKGILAAIEELKNLGRVDYLVQSQGGPPTGRYVLNDEGLEKRYVVQCLSKFAIAHYLLREKVLQGSLVCIAAPGSNLDLDPTDPQFARRKDYGLITSGKRDSVVIDSFTKEFNSRFSVKAYHVFPGLVATNAAKNADLPIPKPLATMIGSLYPIIGRIIGTTPDKFADIPVFLAAGPDVVEGVDKSGGNQLFDHKLRAVQAGSWAQDAENRKKLYETLEQTMASGGGVKANT